MSKKPQLSDISGVGEALEEKLRAAGVKTVNSLSKADPKKLAEKVDGLGEKSAKDFVKQAQKLVGPPKKKAKEKKPKAKKPKKKKD
ncbi:DUF4332 domain-containing protein, partial [Candidatus Thorarchaeota archaeon]